MSEKVTLEMTKDTAWIVKTALEFYARGMMGQFKHCIDQIAEGIPFDHMPPHGDVQFGHEFDRWLERREKAKEYAEELRAMNLPGVAIVRSHDYFVEAVPTGGGKGNAIVKIAEYYGVDLSEVIAVGDQENDISMVVKAGLGCCVANAIDELKAVSDFVANDCDNDAIAQIIETFTKD